MFCLQTSLLKVSHCNGQIYIGHRHAHSVLFWVHLVSVCAIVLLACMIGLCLWALYH